MPPASSARHLHKPLFAFALFLAAPLAHAVSLRVELQRLSEDFWTWRATEQPFTNDDIPRLERPANFTADWSPAATQRYLTQIAAFESKFRVLNLTSAPIPDQVDYRLLGSAIARVRWELEVFPTWRQNPFFYVDQGLGSVYTLILPPAPFSADRQLEILTRLESVPALLNQGRSNLTDMRAPYVRTAIASLAKIDSRLDTFSATFLPQLDPANRPRFHKALAAARTSLLAYRDWLATQKNLPEQTAVGREGYLYFLRNVALLPYTPEQILAMGQQEWQRSVAFESLQQAANLGLPQLPHLPQPQSAGGRVRQTGTRHPRLPRPAQAPLRARRDPALQQRRHARLRRAALLPRRHRRPHRPIPPHPGRRQLQAAPIGAHGLLLRRHRPRHPPHQSSTKASPATTSNSPGAGVTLTPSAATTTTPRSNEGLGFYAEEMMLEAGLFDSSPRSKEIIDSFMRLRALRVEVVVRLALGEFSLDQAAQYLTTTVPMDPGTAHAEAAMFASTPGQAITYQIGKQDILHLMSDARRKQGDAFSLQTFHDFLWLNGNVPFSLQRWELLNDASAVPPLAPSFAPPAK